MTDNSNPQRGTTPSGYSPDDADDFAKSYSFQSEQAEGLLAMDSIVRAEVWNQERESGGLHGEEVDDARANKQTNKQAR